MAILMVLVLGLALGSFVNALVWRLHKQSARGSKPGRYSVLKGQSMCPHCRHKLAAKDLVPVFSWLSLQGKCRYCHRSISWQYPLVELISTALFVVSYLFWPYDLAGLGIAAFGLWLLALTLLIALAVYDLKWMLLPDRLTWPLTAVSACLAVALTFESGGWGHLVGALAGGLLLSGLFWLLFQISSGKWIGGGDVKLAVSLGLIAGGLPETFLLLFIASLLGSVVGVGLIVAKQSASHKVPFGPFLITATYLVFIWGQVVIDWYQNLLLV